MLGIAFRFISNKHKNIQHGRTGSSIKNYVERDGIVWEMILEAMEEYRNLPQSKLTDQPKIVCICGSGRFLNEMYYAEEKLTLEGKIVLTIGVNTKDVARTENMEHYKPMLDELHLRKIDLSDEVLIINVGGYIGESTKKEIEYSVKTGKPITYLEPKQ